MNEDTFFEIDEPSDWVIIEALMKKNGIAAPEEIPEIRLFLTDCDGCLTDAGMYYSEHGDELKKFNARDGMAFALLREQGILTGLVTRESMDLNRRRAEKMKLDFFESGCMDKVEAVRRICSQCGISPEQVAYVGDDINDLEVIRMVGYGCAPADAMPEVKAAARYVTRAKGGEGVIREVVEKLLDRNDREWGER